MTDLQAPSRSNDTLCLPLEIKASDTTGSVGSTENGEDWGTFEGYGSVFGNQDRDGDIVARGAFADSLKSGLPALLWQHDQKAPIGRFDVVREDKRGLYVKGRLSMSGRGREAYDLLKMGALNGLSIGFVTREATRDKLTGARTILKADLMEVSMVTFPANELARVQSVKAQSDSQKAQNDMLKESPMINDTRTFERLLRDNGFSRTRAKAITAKGFRAGDLQPDESAEIAEMITELKARRLSLEEKAAASAAINLLPRFGPWKIATPSITLSKPTNFSLIVSRRSSSIMKNPRGPIFLEVSYVSPTGKKVGKWQSSANGTPNRFLAAAGVQTLKVRGRASGFGDAAKVTFQFK